MKILLPLTLGVGLVAATGCLMTIAEVRELPPLRTGEFAIPYERLARCIQREFQTERGTFNALTQKYDLDISPADNEARVFVCVVAQG